MSDVIARLRDIVEGSPGGFPPDSLFVRLLDVCEAARAWRDADEAYTAACRAGDPDRVYPAASEWEKRGFALSAALARLEATDA